MLLFNSKALLSQPKLCDATVNFICVGLPKFTAASRDPPCDYSAIAWHLVKKDFPENQLAEFCALVTIGKGNWEHGFLNHWYSIVGYNEV